MWMIGRVVLLIAFVSACTSPPLQPEPGEQLAVCGSFPNCVSSRAKDGDSAVDPLVASQGQWQSLVGQLSKAENWSVTTAQDNFVQAVVTSPLMRYKDDVQLQYHPGLQLIHVRSSSRLGYSDMGVNRERVEFLRSSLQAM